MKQLSKKACAMSDLARGLMTKSLEMTTNGNRGKGNVSKNGYKRSYDGSWSKMESSTLAVEYTGLVWSDTGQVK